MILRRWPEWWEWELELSPHLLKRMRERRFTELELRSMLQHAQRIRRDAVPDRFVVGSRLHGRVWEIIVEPDPAEGKLIVITAYPLTR